MDMWQRARTFAEEAAKRSQELTKEAATRSQELSKEAAKRSQEFMIGSSKLSDIVSEASKRSKEIAAEASKRADHIKIEALKRADQRARTFAEEAAKRSQELTKEAAKRSQELSKEAAKRSQEFMIGSSKLSDIVSEASKRSKEIAAEASKRADHIKIEALKRADQIKSQIPASALSHLVDASSTPVTASTAVNPEDLEKFGVTDELREFAKEITKNTFQDFPLEDDSEMSDIPTVSNVRQDLTEWQEIHAKLVLMTVKEISKLRYELCPRVMKERKFWRIYFILVNSHVAPYEKRYMGDSKQKSAGEVKDDVVKETSRVGTVSKTEVEGMNQKSKNATTSNTEQDLDVFLLGDQGDSDDGPDDGNESFDDDFDKI